MIRFRASGCAGNERSACEPKRRRRLLQSPVVVAPVPLFRRRRRPSRKWRPQRLPSVVVGAPKKIRRLKSMRTRKRRLSSPKSRRPSRRCQRQSCKRRRSRCLRSSPSLRKSRSKRLRPKFAVSRYQWSCVPISRQSRRLAPPRSSSAPQSWSRLSHLQLSHLQWSLRQLRRRCPRLRHRRSSRPRQLLRSRYRPQRHSRRIAPVRARSCRERLGRVRIRRVDRRISARHVRLHLLPPVADLDKASAATIGVRSRRKASRATATAPAILRRRPAVPPPIRRVSVAARRASAERSIRKPCRRISPRR